MLLVLAVGAVTAGIIAKVQADRAERNFAAAEDTVNGLIFQIAQGLRNVEGIRVESLDKILGQARKTVERLTETDPDNPALLRSKAVMLDEFAKTYLAAGNLAAARKSAEESHAILSRLAEAGEADKDASAILGQPHPPRRREARARRPQGGARRLRSRASPRPRARGGRQGRYARPADVAIDLDRIADIKLYAGDTRARSRPTRRPWPSGARSPRQTQ